MKEVIAALSFVGLIVSVGANISAISGASIAAYMPFVFLLHAGAVLLNIACSKVIYGAINGNFFMKEIKGLPPLLACMVYVLMLYVLAVFIKDVLSHDVEVYEQGGGYFRKGVGNVIVTEAEFYAYQAKKMVSYSAFWILFYLRPVVVAVFSRKV